MKGANPELVFYNFWQPLHPMSIALPPSLIRRNVTNAKISNLAPAYFKRLGVAASYNSALKREMKGREVVSRGLLLYEALQKEHGLYIVQWVRRSDG